MRIQLEEQIISNLLTAGVLKVDEVSEYRSRVMQLSTQELLTTLVKSHQLREEAWSHSQLIIIRPISLN